jgi:hypothetical protein
MVQQGEDEVQVETPGPVRHAFPVAADFASPRLTTVYTLIRWPQTPLPTGGLTREGLAVLFIAFAHPGIDLTISLLPRPSRNSGISCHSRRADFPGYSRNAELHSLRQSPHRISVDRALDPIGDHRMAGACEYSRGERPRQRASW